MIKKIVRYFQRRYWLLGFSDFDEKVITGERLLDVKYMKGLPKNKWYADPFILDVTNNTIEVLVEEFTYSIGRGRIAHITIDKKSLRLLSETIILDLPTHLSFPAIYRNGEEVFIYPENSAAGMNVMYKYDVKNNVLDKKCMLAEEPLTDAVIFTFEGKKYMFSTKIPKDNSNELLIYKMNSNGRFELCSEYSFKNNIARNAGDVLSLKGKYYRVAQDCTNGYGGGVIFQEFTMRDGAFLFKKINEIFPFSHQFALHTFNTYKGVSVIDVSKARHPYVYWIISVISRLVH